MKVAIDNVFALKVDDNILIDRLSKLRVHIASDRAYQLEQNPQNSGTRWYNSLDFYQTQAHIQFSN